MALGPHQEQGIHNMDVELSQSDRAQCIMALGTGSGAVIGGIAEKATETGPKRVFGYAYTSERLRQNVSILQDVLGDVPIIIASAPPQSGADDPGVTYLTNVDDIRRAMLETNGKTSVFMATYDGAEKLSEAQRLPDGTRLEADLALADQAERTAGRPLDAPHAHILSDENVAITKRAFFSATPRATDVEDKASGAASMDDAALYGRRVVDLSFARARDQGIVADYDIYVAVVDKDQISARDHINQMNDDQRNAVVGDIAIKQVMEDTGHRRVLTYHNRIEHAQMFAQEAADTHAEKGIPTASINHMSGLQERRDGLALLSGEAGILSNVGVVGDDAVLPKLEMVAFLGRTESIPRTIQSISQATRIDRDNRGKRAAVVIPLVVDEKSEAGIEAAIYNQRLETLTNVTRAMRLADDTLDGRIRDLSRNFGRLDEIDIPSLKFSGLGGVSPEIRSSIEKSLKTATIREIADPFDVKFSTLDTFVKDAGRLPDPEKEPELSAWVNRLRLDHKTGRLPKEQATAFDEMEGWSWVDPKSQSRTVAQHLARYAARRDATPPYKVYEGPRTGAEDLGDYLFDADRARMGEEGRFHIGSQRKAAGLAEAIDDHAEKSGDRTLIQDTKRTTQPEMKGIVSVHEDDSGKRYRFAPFGRRIPHFDTGVVRSNQDSISFDLEGVTGSQAAIFDEAVAHKGATKSAYMTLDISPVVDKDGRYSLKEAKLESIIAVSGKKVGTAAASIPTSVFGRFSREADETGKDVYKFHVVKHHSGPKLPKVSEISEPSKTVKSILGNLPDRDYVLQAKLSKNSIQEDHSSVSILDINTSRVYRRNEPDTFNAKALLNRLEDRSIEGKPDYFIENFKNGKVNKDDEATNLNPKAPQVSAMTVRKGMNVMQKKHSEGTLSEKLLNEFDAAPGFSWVETHQLKDRLSPALQQIEKRYEGRDVLADPAIRKGNNGLANTLKVADEVLKNPDKYPDARSELAALKKDGLIFKLKAAQHERKDSSDVVKTRRRDDAVFD